VKENGWLCGTGCLRISLGGKILNPLFLYYYLELIRKPVIQWKKDETEKEVHATNQTLGTE
ncbi:MAG: hypothetical protein ACRDHW_21335, partial [Ktedonobacteraceae bacterium]